MIHFLRTFMSAAKTYFLADSAINILQIDFMLVGIAYSMPWSCLYCFNMMLNILPDCRLQNFKTFSHSCKCNAFATLLHIYH